MTAKYEYNLAETMARCKELTKTLNFIKRIKVSERDETTLKRMACESFLIFSI